MIISDDNLYNNDGTKVQFEDPDVVNQSLEQIELDLNYLNYPGFNPEEKTKEPTTPNGSISDLLLSESRSFNPASAGLNDYRAIYRSVIPLYQYQTKRQYDRHSNKKS